MKHSSRSIEDVYSLLVLDSFPESRAQRIKILTKVLVKEGFLLGDWDGVTRALRSFGSVRIPDALIRTLIKNGVALSQNRFEVTGDLDTVVVIKDVRCLRWAIDQKRAGTIRRLIVGPFIATIPSEYDEILLSPEIDALLFLSEWHRSLFHRLAGREVPESHVWFAGVDTEWWHLSTIPRGQRDQVIIYKKAVPSDVFRLCQKLIEKRGLKAKVVEYGHYAPEEFRKELAKSQFVVFLSQSETQGLASFEAWSSDVPTIHYDPGVMSFLGQQFQGASSCGYLHPEVGRRFAGPDDLKERFDEFADQMASLSPRRHVLGRYTLQHSASHFLSIVSKIQNQQRIPMAGGSNAEKLNV